MRLRYIFLAVGVIAIVLLSVFVFRRYEQQKYACPTIVRTAPLTIPAYSNAQQEHPITQPGDGDQVQHIGFQTIDTPRTVIAFYKDRLAKEGWSLHENTDDTFFRFGHTEAVPLYSLDVEIAPIGAQLTSVRVRLWYGPCLRA